MCRPPGESDLGKPAIRKTSEKAGDIRLWNRCKLILKIIVNFLKGDNGMVVMQKKKKKSPVKDPFT